MRTVTTRGAICVIDEATRLEYRVATIEYTEREDDEFRYVIRPNYSVISLIGPPLFQGIPGLNLATRRKEFVRENRTPVFVSERTPAENREDVRDLLDDEGLDYLNRLEWLIRTKTRYSGDNLYVTRLDEGEKSLVEVGDLSEMGTRSALTMKAVLDLVCRGCDVVGEGFRIDDSNRAEMHALLRALYVKEKTFIDGRRREGVAKAAAEGKYKGRRRLRLDEIRLADVMGQYERGSLDLESALRMLDISRATFFRRLSDFRERREQRE